MKNQHLKKYNFYINGMRCNACVFVIENELNNYEGVSGVKVSLDTNSIEVVGDFGNRSLQEIVDFLTIPIKDNGYIISIEPLSYNKKLSEFKIAIPIALVFIVFFFLLQKIGFVNLIGGNSLSFGTAFIVGIVASLSSCMAVVGGLLLSMSATFSKNGGRFKSQIMFHLGRLISFFILGGVIGVLGSLFTLNSTITFIISMIIGVVMIILGINLIDVSSLTSKFQIKMPKFVGSYAHKLSKINNSFIPFVVGVATFFLPCGFTQSMQLYTLSSKSFFVGSMTMFIFALGTLPVLLLISFSSFNIKGGVKSGVFFKSVGIIVILFAIFNIINSLASVGIIDPLFNF